MTKMTEGRAPTRIQREKTRQILDAALDVFSTFGFRGATVDQIAKASGLSKPNMLYYFASKEAIHASLLETLLDTWLDPLRALDPDGEPLEEILAYVRRKLQMSQDFPRESRLFANEMLQGAPRVQPALSGDLKTLVDEKVTIIQGWMDAGHLTQTHPYHLIFSIWSLTQHYADFDVQVRSVLGKEEPFEHAQSYLDQLFRALLTS